MAERTEKETAFLRDLYVDVEWTSKFTEILDESLEFGDEKEVLYLNAGSGGHAIEVSSKLSESTSLTAVCESAELASIAKHKSEALKSRAVFVHGKPNRRFDAVIADGTFIHAEDTLEMRADASTFLDAGGRLVAMTVSASSFGEIHSMLWEALERAGVGEGLVEKLISSVPTVSAMEAMIQGQGLSDVTSMTKAVSFEFEDGKALIESPMMEHFFLPRWLGGLSDGDVTRVKGLLAEIIDEEFVGMTFRFGIKATALTGIQK